MKRTVSSLIFLSSLAISSLSFANATGPKPNCGLGKHAKFSMEIYVKDVNS